MHTNEFDFFLNSIWNQIVANLDLSLNSIFSPADPDLFHKRYTLSFEFVSKFEAKCHQFDKNFKQNLQNSQSFKFFVKKWPIQVYFQLRFTEIASKLEESLINYTETEKQVSQLDTREYLLNDTLNLKLTTSLLKQMEYCWLESKCYLHSLTSQFWKLTLQLLSRYYTFFNDYYLSKLSTSATTSGSTPMVESSTTSNLLDANSAQTQRSRTPTEQLEQTPASIQSKNSFDELNFTILLLNDLKQLNEHRVSNLFIL